MAAQHYKRHKKSIVHIFCHATLQQFRFEWQKDCCGLSREVLAYLHSYIGTIYTSSTYRISIKVPADLVDCSCIYMRLTYSSNKISYKYSFIWLWFIPLAQAWAWHSLRIRKSEWKDQSCEDSCDEFKIHSEYLICLMCWVSRVCASWRKKVNYIYMHMSMLHGIKDLHFIIYTSFRVSPFFKMKDSKRTWSTLSCTLNALKSTNFN